MTKLDRALAIIGDAAFLAFVLLVLKFLWLSVS